jgi:hypothetical protein
VKTTIVLKAGNPFHGRIGVANDALGRRPGPLNIGGIGRQPSRGCMSTDDYGHQWQSDFVGKEWVARVHRMDGGRKGCTRLIAQGCLRSYLAFTF